MPHTSLLVLLFFAACSVAMETAPQITAATFLPEIAGEGAREAHVLYQDGALATPVAGGTLWTFGDTFLGARQADGAPAYTGNRSNTMAFLPEGAREYPPRLHYLRGGDGVAAAPLALLAEEDAEKRRLWPLAGVQIGSRSYLYYGLIDVTGPGPWGFRAAGTGLASAAQAFGPYQRLVGPPGGWPIDPTSIVADGPWLYLFAPRRFWGEQEFRSGLLVARVAAAAIEQPAAYEFFGGLGAEGAPRWVATVEAAVPAAEEVWGQASVVWHPAVGRHVLATSSHFGRPRGIQLRWSATPWGPWQPFGPGDGWLEVPERAGERTQLVYCTMLHPELDAPGERVVTLTFCRLLERAWAFTNPEVVRVGLAGPRFPSQIP